MSAVQLSGGAYRARLSQRQLGGWTLQYLEFLDGTSGCFGSVARDRQSFLVPLAVGRSCRLLGRSLSASEIGVYAPGAEHADVSTGGLAEVVLTPPARLLEDAVDRGENVRLPTSGSRLEVISAPRLEPLRRTLREIGDPSVVPTANDRAVRAIGHELELTLVAALSHASDVSVTGRPVLPRPSVLRRVAEILHRDHDEPVHVAEIARAAGVSYATLRRIFLEWFGTSPHHYLLLKRLYLARRRIVSGQSTTVSDAAMSCGFWELGRFARHYRELFGELPSATLSRANLSDL